MTTHPLRVAVLILKLGLPLPIDLVTKLLSDGYDVASLERKYA